MELIILVAFLPMEDIMNNLSNTFCYVHCFTWKEGKIMIIIITVNHKVEKSLSEKVLAIHKLKLVMFLRIKMLSLILILNIMRPRETQQ